MDRTCKFVSEVFSAASVKERKRDLFIILSFMQEMLNGSEKFHSHKSHSFLTTNDDPVLTFLNEKIKPTKAMKELASVEHTDITTTPNPLTDSDDAVMKLPATVEDTDLTTTLNPLIDSDDAVLVKDMQQPATAEDTDIATTLNPLTDSEDAVLVKDMQQPATAEDKNEPISTSIFEIDSKPSLLVPIKNVGNRCYAIAVLQLLQRMPELWSELVSFLEIESRDFDSVCSTQPLTMATVMLGGELKEQFIVATQRLVKPSSIEFSTLDFCRIKILDQFQINGQEDASEFLDALLQSICVENKKNSSFFEGLFISETTPQMQCQKCYSLRDARKQPAVLYHLSLDPRDISKKISI